MVLWLLAYIIIGQVAMPICLSLLGKSAEDLSVRGHAIMHLCLDLSQAGGVPLSAGGCRPLGASSTRCSSDAHSMFADAPISSGCRPLPGVPAGLMKHPRCSSDGCLPLAVTA